jgi:hypothetical protein
MAGNVGFSVVTAVGLDKNGRLSASSRERCATRLNPANAAFPKPGAPTGVPEKHKQVANTAKASAASDFAHGNPRAHPKTAEAVKLNNNTRQLWCRVNQSHVCPPADFDGSAGYRSGWPRPKYKPTQSAGISRRHIGR